VLQYFCSSVWSVSAGVGVRLVLLAKALLDQCALAAAPSVNRDARVERAEEVEEMMHLAGPHFRR